jgi:hypothetical protein
MPTPWSETVVMSSSPWILKSTSTFGAGHGVFDGVVDEVEDDLVEAGFVGQDERQALAAADVDHDLVGGALGGQLRDHLGDDRFHGDGVDGEVDFAGFDVGGVHEVFDEVDHALVALVDAAEVVVLLFGEGAEVVA